MMSRTDLDDPSTTERRRDELRKREFLRRIYEEWYVSLADALPTPCARALEIGSGAGFLSRHVPGLITSDVQQLTDISIVLDARYLPFASASLDAIMMVQVFHHVPNPESFLTEAARCVRPGGAIVMLEPWPTAWSRFIYRYFHHEPFAEDADWEFTSGGPLTSANIALPWIVFQRDRLKFQARHREWRIHQIVPTMPFRYILSGGFRTRPMVPARSFILWKRLESSLQRWFNSLAMFAYVVLIREE